MTTVVPKQTKEAIEMAHIVREIADVERARKESAKDFRDQLTKLYRDLEELAGDVETGQLRIGDDAEGDIERAVAAMAPAPGSGIDSVTVSFEGHEPVTLDQADHKRLKKALRSGAMA